MGKGRKPLEVKDRRVRNEVYLDPDLAEIVVAIARKRGISKSDIINNAFREYLQRHKDEANS